MLRVLKAHYEVYKTEDLDTLEIYFTNPVGIGENPQHLHEMEKLLDRVASINDGLEILNKYFQE